MNVCDVILTTYLYIIVNYIVKGAGRDLFGFVFFVFFLLLNFNYTFYKTKNGLTINFFFLYFSKSGKSQNVTMTCRKILLLLL